MIPVAITLMKFNPSVGISGVELIPRQSNTHNSTVESHEAATASVAKDSGDLSLARCSHLARLHFNNRLSARGDVTRSRYKSNFNPNSSTCHAKNIIKLCWVDYAIHRYS